MADYGVKALASYTGVNPHTIRIWERRYGAISPKRAANGRRVYSQEDADRLCLLGELTTRGHAISAVARLSVVELERLIAGTRGRPPSDGEGADPNLTEAKAKVTSMLLDRMVASLESFELRDLSAQLASARLHGSVTDFIYQIVLPLISLIGQLVNDEKLLIAHEHALSAILKTHIYQAIYSMGAIRPRQTEDVTAKTPSIIIATQEGDHHEFGILLASLLAESRGLITHFFGSNMPARSLAGAANALRSPVVLLGRSIRMPVATATGAILTQRDYLKELDESLIASTEIWLGGVLEANALKFRARHKIIHISSLPMLDEKFKSLLGE
jgi:DNA-binding transcriptional MerR regulator